MFALKASILEPIASVSARGGIRTTHYPITRLCFQTTLPLPESHEARRSRESHYTTRALWSQQPTPARYGLRLMSLCYDQEAKAGFEPATPLLQAGCSETSMFPRMPRLTAH